MKYFNFILFLFLLFLDYGCSKKKTDINSNIIVIGHGGVGFDSYVNQLPADSYNSITKAIDGLNVDGVDIDVQMDKDFVLWLYHNRILEECTNCQGCIGELSTNYIEQCTYNKNIDQNFINKSKLQKLEEIIKKYTDYNDKPILFLDVNTFNKCYDFYKLGDELDQMISKYDAYTWTEINSDAIEFLRYMRNKNIKYELYIETSDIEKGIQDCLLNSLNGLTSRHNNISSEQIILCHKNNLKTTLWGMIGYNETLATLKKQPDQVITDNIELVFRIIDR